MITDHVLAGYTDLLKDKKFLQWQFMPDEALCFYWDEFFSQHPELEEDLQQAISYLKKMGLNKHNLNEIERNALLAKVYKSIKQKNKIKRRKFFWSTLTSAAAIATIIFGITFFTPSTEPKVISGNIAKDKPNTLLQLKTSKTKCL